MPRFGAELSVPLRRTSIQVRGGLHLQARGTLRFAGDDPAEASAFGGGGRTLAGALGLSVVTAGGFRADLAGRFGSERPAFLAGAALRF